MDAEQGVRMPGPNGEERRDGDELLRVMLERFDRMEDRAQQRFDELDREIRLTRHGGREALTMVTQQLVETVRQVALLEQTQIRHGVSITELERRTSDEGPIDRRFRRHDQRIVGVETAVQTAGKFTWGDVSRVVAGLVAAGVLLTMLVSLVLTLAPPT